MRVDSVADVSEIFHMKWKMTLALLVVLVLVAGFTCVEYYEYVFARHVEGEIVDVKNVLQDQMVITNGAKTLSPQVFSVAVAIRIKDGEIVTASSEDRQWAVAQKGQCAKSTYFPYPPWDLQKAGTYHNARLEKLEDCKK
jgi:hypothetical protein